MNIAKRSMGKNLRALVFFLTFSAFAHDSEELLNLEECVQDFVVETKQIIIPEFPGAFNASIIRWHKKLLLCFRIRDEKMVSTFEIGFVWLDENFDPINKPSKLIIYDDSSTFSQNQDPRLIIVKNKLYITYSNFMKIEDIITRRMFVARVEYKDDNFFIKNPLCLDPFEGSSRRWEKNWVPFNYDGTLLFAYSLLPHRILRPSMTTGACITENATCSLINWDWGELRGGTPALLDGDHYIAFFHSSKSMQSVHSNGKKITHYFMGAYTFCAEPPFTITHSSPEPIIGKHFYDGPAYNTWKPLRAIFPVGLVADKKYFWVTCGKQDFEIWVAKIDKKKLYKSLIPCSAFTGNTMHVATDSPIENEICYE